MKGGQALDPTLRGGVLGSDEQIFGANEQILGRDQSDHLVAPPYDVACSHNAERADPGQHVSPCGRGLFLGSDEQIFGADEQIFGPDQSD